MYLHPSPFKRDSSLVSNFCENVQRSLTEPVLSPSFRGTTALDSGRAVEREEDRRCAREEEGGKQSFVVDRIYSPLCATEDVWAGSGGQQHLTKTSIT